jgi:hypothetical protein
VVSVSLYLARCGLCDDYSEGKMLVKIIETGSGPGAGIYACPTPCAQRWARRPFAPDWLVDDLRAMGLWPVEGDG